MGTILTAKTAQYCFYSQHYFLTCASFGRHTLFLFVFVILFARWCPQIHGDALACLEFQHRTENKAQEELRAVQRAGVGIQVGAQFGTKLRAEFFRQVPVKRPAGHRRQCDVGTVAQGGEGVKKKRTIIRRTARAGRYRSED